MYRKVAKILLPTRIHQWERFPTLLFLHPSLSLCCVFLFLYSGSFPHFQLFTTLMIVTSQASCFVGCPSVWLSRDLNAQIRDMQAHPRVS